MAMKSRVASLLAKTKSSKASIKQTTIDDLRSEKEDLESRLERLSDECNLHQKSAEEARAAQTKAEQESQVAKDAQLKAEEEKKMATEEKNKANEEKEETERVTTERVEEARNQASAAEAVAAAAQKEKASIEEELGARLTETVNERNAAQAAREETEQAAQTALAEKDVLLERMEQAKQDAEQDATLEKAAREKAEVDMRLAEVFSGKLADEVRELALEKENMMAALQEMELLLSRVQEDLVQTRTQLAKTIEIKDDIQISLRESEHRAEELTVLAGDLQQSLAQVQDQLVQTAEAKEDADISLGKSEHRIEELATLVGDLQGSLAQARNQLVRTTEDKENAESSLRESEYRVEELTVLVGEWRERAEDNRSTKENFEQALEKARETIEEYRKEKESAEVEKRGAERRAAALVSAKEDAEKKFDEAQRKWKQGVQPMTTPSESQVNTVRKNRQFRDGAFHVGIAGLTGTGKSTLVNALMGVVNGTPEAASTGTQLTQSVGRYIDARRNYPHIWYDVPGAGTPTAPSWNYFNDQGLFVFDALLVTWDNRFSDVDIAVLESCVRLKIPAFIIRTKSDVHITNIEDRMRDVIDADASLTNKDRKARYSIIPFSARAEYISETRQSVELGLHNANLPSMKVYLISSRTLTKIVQGDKNMRNVRVIDEFDLLNDIWALRRARGSSIPRMHNVRSNTAPVM